MPHSPLAKIEPLSGPFMFIFSKEFSEINFPSFFFHQFHGYPMMVTQWLQCRSGAARPSEMLTACTGAALTPCRTHPGRAWNSWPMYTWQTSDFHDPSNIKQLQYSHGEKTILGWYMMALMESKGRLRPCLVLPSEDSLRHSTPDVIAFMSIGGALAMH